MSATIIPTFRCKNAKAEIKWLCETFEFTEHASFEGENKKIVNAQLIPGNFMIMLSDLHHNEYDKWAKSPIEVSGLTQSAYTIVKNVNEYYEKAKSADLKDVEVLFEELNNN